jgi:putative nucleotidyltransferase with HDIG domain
MKIKDYIAANAKDISLETVASHIEDISTLPHIITKTIKVANDPTSTALDLKEVIENDVALSARILRCVNSSAYTLQRQITNLREAINYLGMREINRLALTASVAELFTRDESIGNYQRRALWKHLVAVGLCARLIAMRQKMVDFEDAFMAGLLHDIGIVLEDQYLHEQFCSIIKSLEENKTLSEKEKNILGYDHAKLGAKVAESWRFPENVKASISYHHMSVCYQGEARAIVLCVEVANLICTLKGYTSVGRKLVQVSQPALNALSLTRQHLSVLAQDMEEELAKNTSLLNL